MIMTLRGKFFVRNGLSLAGVLALAAVGLYGLVSLQQDVQIALREYRELDEIENIGLRITSAKTSLVSADRDAAIEQCRVCAQLLTSFAEEGDADEEIAGYTRE